MANFGSGFQIKVKTEALRTTAYDTNMNVTRLQTQWTALLQVVRNTRMYWIGDGADTKRKEIETLSKDVEEMLLRLGEYVEDLQEMAGGYETAERSNASSAGMLPIDVIF